MRSPRLATRVRMRRSPESCASAACGRRARRALQLGAGHADNILERLTLIHGMPKILRMDNGPELTCQALAQWAEGVVDLAFIPPGEPWKNGYVESFHSRLSAYDLTCRSGFDLMCRCLACSSCHVGAGDEVHSVA